MPARYGDKPWERQKGESAKAYEAFKCYRDLGSTRSVSKVAQKCEKSDTIIRRWSSRWNWTERIRAWDNDIAGQEYETQKQEYQKMRLQQLQIAMQLQQVAYDGLKKMDPGGIAPRDILKFFTEGERIESEIRKESIAAAAGTADDSGKEMTLAESIVNAYKAREGINNDTD